jgi:hypothetical protein
MKFDTDICRVVPENILQERINLNYITIAMLENGVRYRFLLITLEMLGLQELNLINVRRRVSITILEEQTNPIYIIASILKNGESYRFLLIILDR